MNTNRVWFERRHRFLRTLLSYGPSILTLFAIHPLTQAREIESIALSVGPQQMLFNLKTQTMSIDSRSKSTNVQVDDNRSIEVLVDDKKRTSSDSQDPSASTWIRDCQSRVRFRTANGASIALFGARLRLVGHSVAEIEDELGRGREARIELRHDQPAVHVTHVFRSYETNPFLMVTCTLKNVGEQEILVDDIAPIYIPPSKHGLILGDSGMRTWHWYTHGYGHGADYDAYTIGLMEYYDLLQKPGRWAINPLHSWWHTILGDPETNDYALIGAVTYNETPFRITLTPHGLGFNNKLELVATSEFSGTVLKPGQSLQSSEVAITNVTSRPWPALRQFTKLVAQRMNIDMSRKSPPVVWSSWYVPGLGSGITQRKILDIADSISAHRNVWPIDVIHMDYGWSEMSADPDWGNWEANQTKFPNGMKYVADRIREQGFEPGIWIRPSVLNRGAKIAQDRDDMFINPAERGHPYGELMIDSKHPESGDYFANLLEKITQQWGYSYVKIELLTDEWRSQYARMREASGTDSVILACFNYASSLGFADLQRVSNDIHHVWEYPKANKKWLAGALGLRYGAISTVLNFHENGHLWWIDPDGITLIDPARKHLSTPQATDTEMEFYASIVGLSGGVVTVYGDFRKLKPSEDNLLSRLTPSSGETADVMDFFSSPAPTMLKLTLEKSFERWHVVGALNWKDNPQTMTLDSRTLELDQTKTYHVFDFWNWRYLGELNDTLTLPEQQPHQALVISLREKTGQLQLLSTSSHITQGFVELDNVEVSRDEIRGRLTRPPGAHTTRLVFFVPDGNQLECTAGGQTCKINNLALDIYEAVLHYETTIDFSAKVIVSDHGALQGKDKVTAE